MKKKTSMFPLCYFRLILFLFSFFVFEQVSGQELVTYVISNVQNATDGECNGSITIEINPATSFNHLEWSTGEITTIPFIEELCPGSYSVTIYEGGTSSSCRYELTTKVNGEDACYIEHENWEIEQVNILDCLPPPAGFSQLDTTDNQYLAVLYIGSIKINPSTATSYLYQWSNNETGAEIDIDVVGDYTVQISNPDYSDCKTTVSIRVDSLPCDTSNVGNKLFTENPFYPPLIINEFSNGNNHFDEYVELLVVGNYANCESVDFRNFILDDNNGDFSPEKERGTSGRGISPGHLRFPNTENWSNIPVGALIVIFNEREKNSNIGQEDVDDENNDGVYILSATEMMGNAELPSIYDENYKIKDKYEEGTWESISMFDYNDAIQVRYPDGSFCHGISYGGKKVNGGLHDMKISFDNGSKTVYYFAGLTPFESENYTTKEALDKFQTPGKPNNQANRHYIESLCNLNVATWQEGEGGSIKALVHPNPFTNNLYLNIKSTKIYKANISLVDFTGKVVLNQQEDIMEGINTYQLNLGDTQIANGLYNIRIVSDDEVLFSQKVVCIK